MKYNILPEFPFPFRFVRFYTGSKSTEFAKGGEFYCTDPKCHKGALKADEALVSKIKSVNVEVDHTDAVVEIISADIEFLFCTISGFLPLLEIRENWKAFFYILITQYIFMAVGRGLPLGV